MGRNIEEWADESPLEQLSLDRVNLRLIVARRPDPQRESFQSPIFWRHLGSGGCGARVFVSCRQDAPAPIPRLQAHNVRVASSHTRTLKSAMTRPTQEGTDDVVVPYEASPTLSPQIAPPTTNQWDKSPSCPFQCTPTTPGVHPNHADSGGGG